MYYYNFYIMMYNEEDSPNINLKLTFDKMTPEIYTLLYLLVTLVVLTIVYLGIYILDFIIIRIKWRNDRLNDRGYEEI